MKPSVQRRVVRVADEATLERCLPVLLELRPRLRAAECRKQIHRQRLDGYALVALEQDGQILAVGGYRVLENLAWGKFLYVDDLVTRKDAQDRGHGQRLIQWLVREARRLGCGALHLDSGVQRFAAHGFYLKHRLHIVAHHFARPLT